MERQENIGFQIWPTRQTKSVENHLTTIALIVLQGQHRHSGRGQEGTGGLHKLKPRLFKMSIIPGNVIHSGILTVVVVEIVLKPSRNEPSV